MAALAAAASRAIEKSSLLSVIVQERRQLAEIVDRSSDGILTIGTDGTVESWNPAMEEMTGVGADDIVGTLGMVQFAPRDAEGKLKATLAALLEATTVEVGFAVHTHPSLAEAIKEAALAADGEAIHIVQKRANRDRQGATT